MSRNHCTARRALIACTRCRSLKKSCNRLGDSNCSRCHSSGQTCKFIPVRDDRTAPRGPRHRHLKRAVGVFGSGNAATMQGSSFQYSNRHPPSHQYARADSPRSFSNSYTYAHPGNSPISTFVDTLSQPRLSIPIAYLRTTGADFQTGFSLAIRDGAPFNTIDLDPQHHPHTLYPPHAEYGDWNPYNDISAPDAHADHSQGTGSTMGLSPLPPSQNINHPGPSYSSSSSSWTGTPPPSEVDWRQMYPQCPDTSPYPLASQLDHSTSSMLVDPRYNTQYNNII